MDILIFNGYFALFTCNNPLYYIILQLNIVWLPITLH